jgi:hypothetical protein
MAMLGWSEPYYKDVAILLLRLALNAPGEDGPVRSSGQLMARMDPELLVRLYEHDPDRLREAQSLVARDQTRAVKGAAGRFANFFAATAGGFDAGPAGSTPPGRPATARPALASDPALRRTPCGRPAKARPGTSAASST